MSLLRTAIRDVLRPVVKQVAGVAVRYHHAANGMVYNVVATLDGADGEAEANDSMAVPFHVGIFKIDRLDLPVMPQRLDRIEWIDPDNTARVEFFQVLSDGASDYAQPNGNFRDVWRINAKWIPTGDDAVQVVYGNADGTAYGNADGVGYGSPSR